MELMTGMAILAALVLTGAMVRAFFRKRPVSRGPEMDPDDAAHFPN